MRKNWLECDLQRVADSRGNLAIGEVDRQLPFIVRRFFVATDVPAGVNRGGHAHKTIEQFAVCVHGRVTLTLDDGIERTRLNLNPLAPGVFIPAMVWDEWSDFSPDAVLLVLASREFDESDYVRDYQRFIELVRG